MTGLNPLRPHQERASTGSEIGETWKSVVGYEGLYEVSDLGRVRSLDRSTTVKSRWGSTYGLPNAGRVLKSSAGAHGYQQVILYRAAKKKTHLVHRIVLDAFVGPCPENMEGCHGDGDRENNSLENLRYGTRKENLADRFAHGTVAQGEGVKTSKLTADEVLKIRAIGTSMSQREIAKIFGVSQYAISCVLLGKSWRHVNGL